MSVTPLSYLRVVAGLHRLAKEGEVVVSYALVVALVEVERGKRLLDAVAESRDKSLLEIGRPGEISVVESRLVSFPFVPSVPLMLPRLRVVPLVRVTTR